MVSIKKRNVKGETYLYVSASATYRGRRKVFERSAGPAGEDKELLERRKAFLSELLEHKRQFYLTYLEARDTRFQHLPDGYAYFLSLARNQYHHGLSKMYPDDLEKYRKEQEVRYVHHTTAIEGNTLTLREAAMILEEGMTPGTKDLREVHEVENYRHLRRFTTGYRKEIDTRFIQRLHYHIMRNIDDDSAGCFRRIPVGIVGSSWEPPHPVEIEEALEELMEWYGRNRRTIHPLELAGLFHHRFLQVHPFRDGNGRVGRELMNAILIRNGFPPIIIPLGKRMEYFKGLEEADKGNPAPLLELLAIVMIEDYLVAIGSIMKDISVALGELNDEEKRDLLDLFHWNVRLCMDVLKDVPPRLVETIKGSGLMGTLA